MPNFICDSANRLPKVLLSCLLVLAACSAGCGGETETEAPAVDELDQFLQDNPDIADGSGEMGDE